MSCNSTITSPLSAMDSFLDAVGRQQGIDLKQIVRNESEGVVIRLLKPSLGSLEIRSDIPNVLSVYHHPPATTLGYVGAYLNADTFVVREIDLMLCSENQWKAIRYESSNLSTKNPAELHIYGEAWGETLEAEDWLLGDVVDFQVLQVEAGHDQPAHKPRMGLFDRLTSWAETVRG